MLAGLSLAHFPNQGQGPLQLGSRANAALSGLELDFAKLQPRMAEWHAVHPRLIDDPDTEIELT